jgi:hypothetical protein
MIEITEVIPLVMILGSLSEITSVFCTPAASLEVESDARHVAKGILTISGEGIIEMRE